MLLIWGFKSYVRLIGIITLVCGNCHNPAAQRVIDRVRKFTFFWIPLFPVKRQTIMTCTFCGVATVLSKEDAATLAAQMSNPQPAVAGAETQVAVPAGSQVAVTAEQPAVTGDQPVAVADPTSTPTKEATPDH